MSEGRQIINKSLNKFSETQKNSINHWTRMRLMDQSRCGCPLTILVGRLNRVWMKHWPSTFKFFEENYIDIINLQNFVEIFIKSPTV